jgi:mono/diheme cytochrome c family protein
MNMSNMGSVAYAPATPLSPLDTQLSQGDAVAGQQLFQTLNCAACHGASGAGGIGPKLQGIAGQVSPNQLYEGVKHPRGPMPDFHLSDTDIANLVAYVVSLTPGQTVAAEIAKAHAAQTAPMNMRGMGSMAQPPPVYPVDQKALDAGGLTYFPGVETGDPAAGQAIYARSCAQCHGAGGQGAGAVPGLTTLATHLTPSSIAWHIKQHAGVTPPMNLTDKDISDLTAFLETLGVK